MPDPDAARERRASPCVLRGDEDALYRAHADRLRRTVRGLVAASDDQVDDACATAWLILLRSQPHRDTAFGWLVTVAVRETWRLTRADRTAAPVHTCAREGAGAALDPPAELLDPLAPMHARERLRAVAQTLPVRKRRLVALQALGFTYAEIAELTGDTPRTVDRQLRYAKRLLDPLREPLPA
jgi:RNA polymerase sigma factor (sigma-70 family)